MDTKAIFRCKRSGNTIAFSREHDIIAMRKEPGYEEITQCDDSLRAEPNTVADLPPRRGRPRKG